MKLSLLSSLMLAVAARAATVSVTVSCTDPAVTVFPAVSVDAGQDAGFDAGPAPAPAIDAGAPGAGADAGASIPRTATVWTWFDSTTTLARLPGLPFTTASPALYQMNYAYLPDGGHDYTYSYDGGVPPFSATPGGADFFGSSPHYTSAQYCAAVHDAGMKCTPLIFAGAANGGTDTAIQNILNDSPPGTQTSFINSLVSEGLARGYDGWNLDWEVSNAQTTYVGYGPALINFLAALKYALNSNGMTLSFDVIASYVKQSWCSGGTGLVDLTAIGPVVDQVIDEAYWHTLGTGPDGGIPSGCPSHINNPQVCSQTLASDLNLMCTYLPASKYVVGLEADPSNGTDLIAPQAIRALEAYGAQNVALWPNGSEASLGFAPLDGGYTWPSLIRVFEAGQQP